MSEQLPENERPKSEETSELAEALAEVGRKLRETIDVAWNSQERIKIQEEVKEGLHRFSEELNQAVKSLRDSEVGQKVETGVKLVRDDIESGKVADNVRTGAVSALKGISEALDKLAEGFTPPEEKPKK